MFFKKILIKILKKKRKRKFRNIHIKNEDITIFCNCCIAGSMYHDVGAAFQTPTINLFFGHHSFIDFVNNYESYSDAQLIDTGKFDINENGLHGPICLLSKEGLPSIEIHFLHYNSFEIAKKKWFERYKRINPKKIFLVIEAKDKHEHSLIGEYVGLKYPKVIFTDFLEDKEKSIFKMPIYTKTNKSITSFCNLAGKRGYDDFDFVKNIFNYDFGK